jgi:hypothetical protein
MLRLAQYGHMISVILHDIPPEYRLSLIEWIVAGYDEATGEEKHRSEASHRSILCEDCCSAHTAACETCPVMSKVKA